MTVTAGTGATGARVRDEPEPLLERMVTTVNLRTLHAALKHLAETENRSANATIVVAISECIERHQRRVQVGELAAEVAERHRELLDRLAE